MPLYAANDDHQDQSVTSNIIKHRMQNKPYVIY